MEWIISWHKIEKNLQVRFFLKNIYEWLLLLVMQLKKTFQYTTDKYDYVCEHLKSDKIFLGRNYVQIHFN